MTEENKGTTSAVVKDDPNNENCALNKEQVSAIFK